jgi:hypothetical protein
MHLENELKWYKKMFLVQKPILLESNRAYLYMSLLFTLSFETDGVLLILKSLYVCVP